jgi:hypothetical protein
MQYYRIQDSLDKKIIGRKYPQVERAILPVAWTDPLFIESFIFKKAPDNVLLAMGILPKSAKPTDLISAGNIGFSLSLVISPRLHDIIVKHRHHGMQFFAITLKGDNGTDYPYWLVHVYDMYYEMLDLEQSFIGHYTSLNFRELIRRNSTTDVEALKQELNVYHTRTENDPTVGNICITKIVFKQDTDLDFFALRPVYGGTGFYVSERLKAQIEAAGCTGMVFTAPDERYP